MVARVFVSGGAGFIGRCLVARLVADGAEVLVPARSARGAERARSLGATVVPGDLLVPGPWQRAAAGCDLVVHAAQPPTYGGRITRARAEAWREQRLRMDEHLLGALAAGARVVYVAGTSFYGDTGTAPVGEDAPPVPSGWGPYLAPALERSGRYPLSLVQAFPGAIYGDGSWFREYVAAPLVRGWPVLSSGEVWMSPMHVDDAAAGLLHLARHGAAGQRYFLVDDRPVPFHAFVSVAAAALGVRARTWRVPRAVIRVVAGPVIAGSMYRSVLENTKLRGTGFAPAHPTIDVGIPAVVASMRPIRPRARQGVAPRESQARPSLDGSSQ